MIDTNLLKEDSKFVAGKLKLKNYDLDIELFESLEADRKKFQTKTEDLQAQRNSLSKDYGILKKKGKDDDALRKKIESINFKLDGMISEFDDTNKSLKKLLLDIPNLPDESVPIGVDEQNNILVREHGVPSILSGKDHLQITSMIDTESANLLAGSRFAVLSGEIAKLQRD